MSLGSGPGNAPNQFNSPDGVVVLNANCSHYVVASDYNNHRLQVLDIIKGVFVRQIGNGQGSRANQLNGPSGLVALPEVRRKRSSSSRSSSDLPFSFTSHVAVCDYLNHRIQIVDAMDGSFIRSIGGAFGPGSGPTDFHSPQSVTVLNDGCLAVSDTWNHRLQIIDPVSGAFVRTIGPQNPLTTINSHVTHITRPLSSDGVVTDHNGDPLPNISMLDAGYSFVQTPPGRLHYPHGVLTLPNGQVAVCVSYNHRVQILDPKTGELHAVVGAGRGSLAGQFNRPFGLAVVTAEVELAPTALTSLSTSLSADDTCSDSSTRSSSTSTLIPTTATFPQRIKHHTMRLQFSHKLVATASAHASPRLERPMLAHFMVVSDAWNHRLQVIDIVSILPGWVSPSVTCRVLSHESVIPRTVLPSPLLDDVALHLELGDLQVARAYYEKGRHILLQQQLESEDTQYTCDDDSDNVDYCRVVSIDAPEGSTGDVGFASVAEQSQNMTAKSPPPR